MLKFERYQRKSTQRHLVIDTQKTHVGMGTYIFLSYFCAQENGFSIRRMATSTLHVIRYFPKKKIVAIAR